MFKSAATSREKSNQMRLQIDQYLPPSTLTGAVFSSHSATTLASNTAVPYQIEIKKKGVG